VTRHALFPFILKIPIHVIRCVTTSIFEQEADWLEGSPLNEHSNKAHRCHLVNQKAHAVPSVTIICHAGVNFEEHGDSMGAVQRASFFMYAFVAKS